MKFYVDNINSLGYTKFRKSKQEVNMMPNETVFNYSKLKGRIKEKCGTCFYFAKQLGCSNNTLSAKLNNTSDFSQTEIIKSVDILGLKVEDISTYFFTPKV